MNVIEYVSRQLAVSEGRDPDEIRVDQSDTLSKDDAGNLVPEMITWSVWEEYEKQATHAVEAVIDYIKSDMDEMEEDNVRLTSE